MLCARFRSRDCLKGLRQYCSLAFPSALLLCLEWWACERNAAGAARVGCSCLHCGYANRSGGPQCVVPLLPLHGLPRSDTDMHSCHWLALQGLHQQWRLQALRQVGSAGSSSLVPGSHWLGLPTSACLSPDLNTDCMTMPDYALAACS